MRTFLFRVAFESGVHYYVHYDRDTLRYRLVKEARTLTWRELQGAVTNMVGTNVGHSYRIERVGK